jgi:aminoglycoside phosphotransferase
MRSERATTFAEVRARTALAGSHLDPSVPLERASSVTNEVWLTADHVIRVNRRSSSRLFRESVLGATLPAKVGYPPIVGRGGKHGEDWLVSERVPGRPLAHVWADLSADERCSSIHQLVYRLKAVHQTPVPVDLPEIPGIPSLLRLDADDPIEFVLLGLEEASQLEFVDPTLMQRAAATVDLLAPALLPDETTMLVHGDITFENVLWHQGTITALIDFEFARPGPKDLDLDVILRCVAFPDLHVAPAYRDRTTADEYAMVPQWLEESYPELFDHPRQIDRLRIYSIAYDVRDLLTSPPTERAQRLPPSHAYQRLAACIDGVSYLDSISVGSI